jgi:hypothetical protein
MILKFKTMAFAPQAKQFFFFAVFATSVQFIFPASNSQA